MNRTVAGEQSEESASANQHQHRDHDSWSDMHRHRSMARQREREEIRRRFYDQYNPWTGIDIALTLGSCLLVFSLYLLIKHRHRKRRKRRRRLRQVVADVEVEESVDATDYLQVPRQEYGRDPLHTHSPRTLKCDRCRQKYYNTLQYQLCRHWLSSQPFDQLLPPVSVPGGGGAQEQEAGPAPARVYKCCRRTYSTPLQRGGGKASLTRVASLQTTTYSSLIREHRLLRRHHSAEERQRTGEDREESGIGRGCTSLGDERREREGSSRKVSLSKRASLTEMAKASVLSMAGSVAGSSSSGSDSVFLLEKEEGEERVVRPSGRHRGQRRSRGSSASLRGEARAVRDGEERRVLHRMESQI